MASSRESLNTSLVQQSQRACLEIEKEVSLSIGRAETVARDAMLSKASVAIVQLLLTYIRGWDTPLAVWIPAAKVGRGTRERFGHMHLRGPCHHVHQRPVPDILWCPELRTGVARRTLGPAPSPLPDRPRDSQQYGTICLNSFSHYLPSCVGIATHHWHRSGKSSCCIFISEEQVIPISEFMPVCLFT
jgi:hypothetical protein